MKYKKLLFLILVLFLSACTNDSNDIDTIYYNLNISTTFDEKINIYLTKDAYKLAKENEKQEESITNLEYKLLYEDIEPIFSVHDVYYNKDIKKRFNDIKVELSYNYLEDDFVYSNYLMNCFENYHITSTEDNVEISLNGEFYCLNDKDNINIKVTSIFDVTSSNGLLVNDAYVWNIDKENFNNVDISYVISRNYDGMLKDRNLIDKKTSNVSGFKIFKYIILFLVLGLLFVLYKKYKNIDQY